MKTLINIIIFVAISLNLSAQIYMAKKSIFARYDSKDINDVKIIMPGNVEVKTTKGSQILIDTEVKTNFDMPVTDAIMKRGRYTISHTITNDGTLIIEMKIPKDDVIVVKGVQLEETFKTTVFVPEMANNLRHVAKK